MTDTTMTDTTMTDAAMTDAAMTDTATTADAGAKKPGKLTDMTVKGETYTVAHQIAALSALGGATFGYMRLSRRLCEASGNRDEEYRAGDRMLQKARKLGLIRLTAQRGVWVRTSEPLPKAGF